MSCGDSEADFGESSTTDIGRGLLKGRGSGRVASK